MMKEIRKNGKGYQVRCPECDAWKLAVVLVRADLRITPGVIIRAKWLDLPEIVCSGCEESVEFLFESYQIKDILDKAYATKVLLR